MVSHPFRRKKRKGWGTEVYREIGNALVLNSPRAMAQNRTSPSELKADRYFGEVQN